ncbi:MAG: LacI family DNA-binding transcriptional regulator [Lachnospiraceae bacterium]|nr:LacI family DNA-binding transcriptional regulator [Lachnospiraceae bacterium]
MVTITDIAAATGVSATTVSNVIHGRSNRVSEETVAKINEAIKKLGYTPNMSARALVSRQSKVVGFINHTMPTSDYNPMDDPFTATFIGIIEKALRENGYYLMVRTVTSSEELLALLRNWNMDGLFINGVFKDSFFETIDSLDIPVVLIDSYIDSKKCSNVGLEDKTGCYMATKYLIDHGHRQIVFAAPPFFEEGVVHERFEGYKKALAEAGIPFDESMVIQTELDYDSCLTAARNILELPGVTGIVATADVLAAGIMIHLRSFHKSCPKDYSIIGFDDLSLAKLITPPLTTVHQDMNMKGSIAVDIMLKKLEGEPLKHSHVTLPTELVIRESVSTLFTKN